MPEIGGPELLIVLLIVLMVFGGSKVAELGGSMGKSVREFKKAMKDDEPSTGAASSASAPAATAGTPATTVATQSKINGPSCSRCGAPNLLYALYCNECGAQLSTTTTGALGMLASRRLGNALVHR